MNTTQRKKLGLLFPDIAPQLHADAQESSLERIFSSIPMIKGDKGDKGDKGEQGNPGLDGIDGKDGAPGLDGIDGKNGADGETVVGRDGRDGKDGSPDSPEEIVLKLNTLKEAIDVSVLKGYTKLEDIIINVVKELKTGKNRLEAKDILNLPQGKKINTNDLRWHGSGVPSLTAGNNITLTLTADGGYSIASSGGGGLTEIVISGTIDDTNVTFTSLSEPSYLVINGVWYKSTGGSTTWTYVAGTITLSSAVGTGGTIWGF
jgi:hypothetical protein